MIIFSNNLDDKEIYNKNIGGKFICPLYFYIALIIYKLQIILHVQRMNHREYQCELCHRC